MPTPIKALKNSINGLKLAWEDHSFRIAGYQMFVGIAIASGLTGYYHWQVSTWLMLVASVIPILIVEAINTSIEAVTDKASPERHPLAKKAKDIGSGAVLLTRILALICWAAVLYDKFAAPIIAQQQL